MGLQLQGGHFDQADRLFNDIAHSWKSASQANQQDVSCAPSNREKDVSRAPSISDQDVSSAPSIAETDSKHASGKNVEEDDPEDLANTFLTPISRSLRSTEKETSPSRPRQEMMMVMAEKLEKISPKISSFR